MGKVLPIRGNGSKYGLFREMEWRTGQEMSRHNSAELRELRLLSLDNFNKMEYTQKEKT